MKRAFCTVIIYVILASATPSLAATSLPFIVNMSEAVTVTGCPVNCPRIAVDVGGVTRYATYTSGSGTSTLTFTYDMVGGDLDLDGVTLSSPLDLNGGTITDLNGNPETNLSFTVPNTSGVKVDYPSLSMDFVADADGRYTLNGAAYNDLSSFLGAVGGTFTRNSVATYFDSTGTLQTASNNIPRFDYDPVTHAPKGILIEEARTNQAYYSTDPASWINNGVTVTPTGMTELGIFQSVRLASTGQTYHRMNTRRAPSGGNDPITAPVVVTFYYRGGTSGKMSVTMYVTDASASSAIYVASGICGTATTSGTAGTITILKHEYVGSACMLQFYFTPNNTVTGTTIGIGPYSSVVGEDVIVLGAQVEYATFPTSFIVTGNGTATRQADSLTMPTGGWFNSSEGQLYAAVEPNAATYPHYPQIALFGDGTSSNFIAYTLFPGNNFVEEWKQSGSTLFTINGGNVPMDSTTKLVGAYKSTSSAISKNGAAVVTSSASLGSPAMTTFSIGSNIARGGSDGWYSGTLSNLKYYPSRAMNTQLQLLTQ